MLSEKIRHCVYRLGVYRLRCLISPDVPLNHRSGLDLSAVFSTNTAAWKTEGTDVHLAAGALTCFSQVNTNLSKGLWWFMRLVSNMILAQHQIKSNKT